MNNLSINNPFKPIAKTLRRINLVLFIVVVTCGLVAYVFTMNTILQKASDNVGPNTKTTSAQFDPSINAKFDQYKPSSKNLANQPLPSGRFNPFAE